MARPIILLFAASLLAPCAASAQEVIEQRPVQSAPGHLMSQLAEPAAIPRNAELIRRLELASGKQRVRIGKLADEIERIRIARGEEIVPPPPPPPPPYIQLSTLRQQTEHIARLRAEIIWQRNAIANLEKTLRRLRRR